MWRHIYCAILLYSNARGNEKMPRSPPRRLSIRIIEKVVWCLSVQYMNFYHTDSYSSKQQYGSKI
jgi:hypothetical protein